jgi:hypothetical protein
MGVIGRGTLTREKMRYYRLFFYVTDGVEKESFSLAKKTMSG